MHHSPLSETFPLRYSALFFRGPRLVWRGVSGGLRWEPAHGIAICDDYYSTDPQLDSVLDLGQLLARQQAHGGETGETRLA